MASKQSPFYDVDYGWAQGEGDWNTGMDDNLVKLGFFARRVVDTFETVLPVAPSNGRSCILPNNTVNVYVEKWYTLTPTTGEIYKVAGSQYEFTGSAFTLKVQAEDVQATLTPQIDQLKAANGVTDLGTISTNTTITITDKLYVKAAIGGDLSFTINDLPAAGEVVKWTLELEMLGVHVVTFPATVWEGGLPPTLGDSGKKIINFINSGGTRFGQVEVGNVLVESSQGVFLGGSVVVPSTNPSASAGGTTPSDVITTEDGQVFLKEGKVAAVTDDVSVAKIRQYAPWLEIGVYEKTYSNITFLSGSNVITAQIIDFLWDSVSSQWICLTLDVSGTGSTVNRARILTSPDLVTFTLTTGLNTNNLTDATWRTLLKFTDGDGVVKFMLTNQASSSSGVNGSIQGFISTTFSAVSWTSRTVIPVNGGTTVSLNTNSVGGYERQWLTATGTTLSRFNVGATALETVFSAGSNIIAADYDGVSKYYCSLVGSIVDQTNSSIGLSFVAGNNATTGSGAIAPFLRYIPELAGWIAIETRLFTATATSTVVPRVFFRPDSTQVWGQISNFPSSVKVPGSDSNMNSVNRPSELVYYNNTLIVTGLIDINVTGSVPTFWTHAATSTDGGVTWDVVKVSDVLLPLTDRTSAYVARASKKRNKAGEYFKLVNNSGNGSPGAEYILSVGSGDAFVETNQSAASPTVTSVYTRIV